MITTANKSAIPPVAHSSTRRPCDELGLCQGSEPACPGCGRHDTLQLPSGEGGRPDNAPRQMFKANLAAELGGGFHGGLEAQHVTRRLAASGTQAVGAYTLVNLNLRYQPPARRWALSLGLYNLLDRRFSDPVAEDSTIAGPRWSMPQLGRTALLRGSVDF